MGGAGGGEGVFGSSWKPLKQKTSSPASLGGLVPLGEKHKNKKSKPNEKYS